MLASFHIEDPGPEYQSDVSVGIPRPDHLEDQEDQSIQGPIEVRNLSLEGIGVRYWARVPESLGDDRVLHSCAVLYASDLRTGTPVTQALGWQQVGLPMATEAGAPRRDFGSLDHAMWFHRPTRADEWFLVSVHLLSLRDGRGLVHGTVHDMDDNHVATFTQELFFRQQDE
jgi:acyl-CoA thioesterase II